MGPDPSRRALVGAALGGFGLLVGGGHLWDGYIERYSHLIRSLTIVNDSLRPVAVTVTVGTDLESGRVKTHRLEPDGAEDGRDRIHDNGPWLKRAEEYAIRVEHDDARLELDAREIRDRLDTGAWGRACAAVTVTVLPGGSLESAVSEC